MLSQRRPQEKFSGDLKKIDLESYMKKFDVMMEVPGATDAMKLPEMVRG
jgi:hypothetical protein